MPTTPHTLVRLYVNSCRSFARLSFWPKVCGWRKHLYISFCLFLASALSLSLSDMLMLSILIGNRTEPSADKKTMLAAAHRFLPGALKGVLQTVSEFMGFSQSVVLQIVSTVSSGLCLTACFYQRGVYELNVCLPVCVLMIVSVCTYRWYSVHCLCCVYTSTISKVNSLFLLLTWLWPQDHWCVFALLMRMFTPRPPPPQPHNQDTVCTFAEN